MSVSDFDSLGHATFSTGQDEDLRLFDLSRLGLPGSEPDLRELDTVVATISGCIMCYAVLTE